MNIATLLLALAVQADTVVLVGFRILDVESGTLSTGEAVLVVDGYIADRRPEDALRSGGARRIDGSGRVLLPGLVDAHAHVDSADLGLFLANGVTSVREMNGSSRHLAWRSTIVGGALPGPRLVIGSALLTGTGLRVRHELLDSPERAEAVARRLAAAGYDHAKVYDDLTASTYGALARTARELGLPLTGHIPSEVGLTGVLAAGQALEHAEKIVNDVLGHGLEDLELLNAAADAIAAAEVPVTPTLAVQEVLNSTRQPGFDERLSAPELQYVGPETLAWWSTLGGAGGPPPMSVQGEPWPDRYLRAQRELVVQLAERGVPILVGTDTPNPLMVPGFSVHDELAALVRAGLTPLAALRAATDTPGRALPFGARVGRISTGYVADLIAVDRDPREDLSALRSPWAVMSGGRWLGRDELNALLASAARSRSSG